MPKSKLLSIQRYAYTVAGPGDFVINFAINATVAWLLFGTQSSTALFGPHSLSRVWIAIAFFCATLTTFFGYFNAVRQRQAGKVWPPYDRGRGWGRQAWLTAFSRGIPSLFIAICVAAVASYGLPDAEIPTLWAILSTGLFAGTLGYLLHTSAIIRAGELNVPSDLTKEKS